MAPYRLRREEYTVGWVCALPIELAAAQEMLDEEHEQLHTDADDTNIYTLGQIGEHNVVIACLPDGQTGTTSAAAVALQMKSAFKSIRFGLMVGIGGGVPSEADIRLGDVVVSRPNGIHGGVVQYDFGKATPSGFKRTGNLNHPPTILLNALSKLRANHVRGKSRLREHMSKFERLPTFAREDAGPDVLYEADYNHDRGTTCATCDTERVVIRPSRREEIVVHYGTIASGNQVIRDAAERERVSTELGGVLCFEMEAAGLMNSFPCLVIRGVCDYADSHKNKTWQAIAAGTAAACGKEVLLVIPPTEVVKVRTIDETIEATRASSIRPTYSSIMDTRARGQVRMQRKVIYHVGKLSGHTGKVSSVAFSPDGATIASGSDDGSVRIWDAAAGRQLRGLSGHTGRVLSVAFSPDGATIASGSYDGSVKIWDAATGRQLHELSGHNGWVLSVAFSPDGATIASGSYDGSVKIWDAATGRQLHELSGHNGWVLSVAFSPDGATIASGSSDGSVKIWDAATGRQLRGLGGYRGWVVSIAFSPDGATIAYGLYDRSLRIWDAITGKQLWRLSGHRLKVSSVAFSPDGVTIASGSDDGTVRIWDAATERQLLELSDHTGRVLKVAFSPDGATIASISDDGSVRIWDATIR